MHRTLCRLVLVPFALLLIAAATHLWTAQQGEDLLIQRRYQEAAAALAAALPATPAGEQDRVLLLLGEARLLAGDAAGARAALQQLLLEQQGSALVPGARFLLARAHERDRDLRAAAAVYRDEVARLCGFDRKDQVAQVYLRLAERARQQEPPDDARVVTFCDLALDLGLEPRRAAVIALQAAEAALRRGAFADAANRLQPLVAKLLPADGKLRAMLALGRAKRQAGDAAGARVVLRDLQQLQPQAVEAGDAAYEVALTFGVPTPAPEQLDRAVQALLDLAARYPEHDKARVAAYLAAQSYASNGRGEDALRLLQQFLDAQQDSGRDEVPAARAMRGDVLAGQGRLEPAIAAWREYLALHPSHGEWERVQRAIVDAEWLLASRAHAAGKAGFAEARTRFEQFAASYPLDPRNPEVPWRLGDMLRQDGDYDGARAEFERCVSKYPGRDQSSRAQLALGEMYERQLLDPERALQAYRAVTWGPGQSAAAQRIAQLEQKHLALCTHRVFRTDEAPTFALTSRNIETVRVRVLRLDLEDYFRATHTTGDVEQLDLEVIAPDATFDSAVPQYRRYVETERLVELPFRAPGAYVVKVDDQELEATTMVLISDLALVAKSSRHEFLVWTEDTRSQEVAAGVHVVLSDGHKVIAEGVTDAQGFWRYRGPELKDRDDLRVFAVTAGGSGASSVDLSGMGFSAGLTAKGYVYAARPLYLPGERVQLKGIVREVDGGVYKLPAADGYRVRVQSPGGRTLLLRDVKFTAFGTFAIELDLGADAELGDWRVQVDRTGSDQVFPGSFAVQRFERPRLQLALQLDEPVVYRGEPVRGRAVATWFYGEPAAGRQVTVRMQLSDGSALEHAAVTNAAGEVAFEFATDDFGEEALAGLQATLAEEGVAAAAAVPVVTTELEPAIAVPRAVYLANEPLEATATLKDRSGRPLQRDAVVSLLRLERRERDGAVVEVEVAQQAVRTAADGTVRATFRAEVGGPHRLRVATVDRFGTTVTADAQLLISAADDEVKLRLLCDRETFQVGETAAVKVVNRAGERLALLCWQGDGILACESRLLPAGESVLQLPLRPEHAPNFALSLAMIDGNKLHQAERPFLVQRDLQVLLSVPERAAPGSEVEVTVRTLDPQGRPVAAEVALAMVDRSLLAIASDPMPPIGVFFYGQLRETAFRTVASCTWSYQGASRPVDAALVAEEVRRRREQEAQHAADPVVQDEIATGQAFDSNQWNSAVGLGGGKGGRFAGRRDRSTGSGSDDFFLGATRKLQAEGNPLAGAFFDDGFATDIHVRSFFRFTPPAPASNEPRVDFRATGAWLSSVVTGDDGSAKVAVKLPDSTTSWNLLARAVTTDTWVGQGTAQLLAQQPLQIDYRGPSWLCEGDTTDLGVRLHNLTDRALQGRVELEQQFGPQPVTVGGDLELAAHGDALAAFPFQATGSGDLALTLRGRAGDLDDAMQLQVPVRPYGIDVVAGRSGSTRDRAAFTVGLPAGAEYAALRMVVELGPDPSRDLVRAALGAGYVLPNCRQVQHTNLALASRGLGAAAALQYLEQLGQSAAVDRDALVGAIEAVARALVQAQRSDGGYSWIGERRQDLRATAQAVRFLAACRARGMALVEPALDKAVEVLQQAARTAANDVRADLLWALAAAGQARFEMLNGLHRARTGLSVDAQARLALAWQRSGRAELAAEALDALRPGFGADVLSQLPSEAVALATAALLAQDPRDPQAQAGVAWLEQSRRGSGWDTPETTAAAIAALLQARGRADGARLTEVRVAVAGRELATLPATAQGQQTVFEVPADWLAPQGNAVTVTASGGGEVFWSVVLVGSQRGFPAEARRDDLVRITRSYLAAPLRHDGRDVPSGFSAIQGRNFRTWRNEVTQLGQGEDCQVETTFWIRRDTDRERMAPVVVEEPLPAGCSAAPGSISGNYEHVEVQPDRLVLYFGDGGNSGVVSYRLQARYPGSYRVLPTQVQSSVRPELAAHGAPAALRVRAPGDGERDPYRLTPDELFHLGKAEFDAAQALAGEGRQQALQRAQQHLGQLLDDWQKDDYRLRDDVYREVARMQLFLGIERGDARQVVHFFEELKDRYPELVVPFADMLAVGRSYFDLGEFESSLLVFRAVADASFLKDAAVATTLERLGEQKAASRFLSELLRQYPDLPTMRVARYSIGQKLAAVAAKLSPAAPVDERIGSAAELRAAATAAFREFLVLAPEDPLAEEVSFAWATTLLEAQDLAAALAVADAALERYPQSPFEDELLYTRGYACFALARYDDAFAALDRIATGTFATERGGLAESGSKWHAVYLQGQIWHARGEPAKALAAYERVQDRFTDAGEAIDYFQHKELSLPEVTTVATDAPVELEIAFRNVPSATVQVFKVDLMRLYLLQKSLNDIRGIQLHGIAPLQTVAVELGDGRDYRERTHRLPLQLDAPGAYLCVARGGDQLATGLVLRTDLRLELQEQFDQGRVRVNVRRGDGFLAAAHVKVVGSGQGGFRSGDTDLRGVFVADQVVGLATVIVQAGDQFAFFRGTGVHQPQRYTPPRPTPPRLRFEAPSQELQDLRKDARGFDAFEDNYLRNTQNRARQVEWLDQEVLNKQQKGVEVYRAK